jgi:hypothetical protein
MLWQYFSKINVSKSISNFCNEVEKAEEAAIQLVNKKRNYKKKQGYIPGSNPSYFESQTEIRLKKTLN